MNMRAATGQKVKKSREDIIFDVINYTFLTLFTLLCVFPFYYVLINSISANDMVDMGKVMFYPIGIHFNNYVEVLKMERLGIAAWVSLARTVLGTLLAVLVAVAVYGVLLIKLHCIEEDEMYSMPMGRKLTRICRKLHLM